MTRKPQPTHLQPPRWRPPPNEPHKGDSMPFDSSALNQALPSASLDRELRRTKASRLGWALGDAIHRNNQVQLAYILGRLDGEINEDRSWNDTERQLREAACAALNIYPSLTETTDPPTAVGGEVVKLNDEPS